MRRRDGDERQGHMEKGQVWLERRLPGLGGLSSALVDPLAQRASAPFERPFVPRDDGVGEVCVRSAVGRAVVLERVGA